MKLHMFAWLSCTAMSVGAQLPDCAPDIKGANVNSTIHDHYDPALLADDIWGDPELMEDRIIFFVHGLGGQGDEDGTTGISWIQASLWSEAEYMVNSVRPDYNNTSLEAAAMELKADMEMYADADEDALVIAHSQGGIVARRVDEMYSTGEFGFEPRTFGGLVTFGTPHQGAMILNNVDDLQAWIGEACTELSAGPVAEVVEDNFFLDLLLAPADYEAFTNEFCSTVEEQVLPVVMDDYLAGTTSAYSVGAEYLADLNTFDPEIPYVCLWGVENDPVLWNTIAHLFPGREPNNTVTYGLDPFGATNDQTAVYFADAMIGKYWSKYVAYNDLYNYYNDLLTGFDMTTILCYLVPLCAGDAWLAREDAEVLRDAYERGYDWMADANIVWEQIIGARTLLPSGATCTCMDWGPLGDLEMETYDAGPDGICETDDADTYCSITVEYDWLIKESDGVVLKESASECIGNTNAGILYRQMDESNHFSMRNDEQTRLKLFNLYEGHYSLRYKTNKRL